MSVARFTHDMDSRGIAPGAPVIDERTGVIIGIHTRLPSRGNSMITMNDWLESTLRSEIQQKTGSAIADSGWRIVGCRQGMSAPDPGEITALRELLEQQQTRPLLHRRRHQHRVGHSGFPQPRRHLVADAADLFPGVPRLAKRSDASRGAAASTIATAGSARSRIAVITRLRS